MMDFEAEHLLLIDDCEDVLTQIERVLFTNRYKLSRRHSEIFRVQSIAMIYSIWEGFMQQSFGLYIKYIDELNVGFMNLNEDIIIFHMENTFKQFREYPTKNRKKYDFINGLYDFYQVSQHPLYPRVNTESNLGFDVMNKLLEQFGLDEFPEYWDEYTYPKPSLKIMMQNLLRYRNGIAHGGDISNEEIVTQEVFDKYKKLILKLMDGVHDKFINAIDNKTYLKSEYRGLFNGGM